MRDYIIYKITNNINGKIYIGRSVNGEGRWDSHRTALEAKKNKHLRFYRALKKYGVENFSFEVIDRNDDFEELKRLECEWILREDAWKEDIGYNMVIETDLGLEFLDEESLERRSKSIYKTLASKGTGKYGLGVRKHKNIFYAEATLRNCVYRVNADTQEDAKRKADLLMIHLRGAEAILNFPHEMYTKEAAEECFNGARKDGEKTYSSNYIGVSKIKDYFVATITKDRRTKIIGYFGEEIKAAEAVDLARCFYGDYRKKKYNFPENLELYKKMDLVAWYNQNVDVKSRGMGIRYDKRVNKYLVVVPIAQSKPRYLGYYENQKEAAEVRDMGILYYGLNAELNYPENIDYYKDSFMQRIASILAKKDKFRGVHLNKERSTKQPKYDAIIQRNKILYYLGLFKSEEGAARAYDAKAIELYGEKAKLNFPPK